MLQSDLVRKTMLVALLAMACSNQAPTTPESLSAAAAVAIPEKDAYERNMRQFATAVCQKELMNTGASLDEKLAATYYDGQRVMLQIADYLGTLPSRRARTQRGVRTATPMSCVPR
jgi:hypothetical protein